MGSVLVIIVAALAGVAGAGLSPGHASFGLPSASPVRGGPTTAALAREAFAPVPTVSIGSRQYAVTGPTAVGPVGTDDWLLVSPSTETLYSVSYAGVITTSNALTGGNATTHWIFGSNGHRTIRGAGFDPVNGALFVSIAPFAGPTYLWVLNGLTLAVTGNVTNFGGSPGFVPAMVYYEAGSGHMLILNSSDNGGATFVAAVLDPGTLTVTHVFSFPCGAYSCYVSGGGVTDIPTANMELVTADSNLSYWMNLANYTLEVFSIYGLYDLGPTAVDPSTGAFLFSNQSTPSAVYEAVITGFYPVTGPVVNGSNSLNYLAGINWDATDGYFVVTGDDPTSSHLELSALNSTGALKGNYTEPAGTGYGSARSTTLWNHAGTATILVDSTGVNQTVRVDLYPTAPRIREAQTYLDNPYRTVGIGVDSTRGIVIEGTGFPSALRAFSVTTGAPLWTDYESNLTSFNDVAVDSTLGTAYVSHGTTGPIEVVNTATGAVVGTISPPEGAGNFFIDPARGILFVEWSYLGGKNLSAYQLTGTGGTLLGSVTVTLPGLSGVTVDSAADRVWVSEGTVAEVFNETTLAWVHNVSAPGTNMYNLGSDNAGRIFIENTLSPTNNILGVYDELTGAWGPNLTLGTNGGGYAADVTDHYLWIEVGSATSVEAYNYLTGTVAGTINFPDVWWWDSWTNSLAWDSATSTVAVSGGISGVELASLIPLPNAPTALAATGGNATAHLSWAAASGGGYPILNYSIFDAMSASGPWTAVGTTSALSFDVTGLTNGNSYAFEVEATSPGGTSAASNVATATPAAVPYPVAAPTAQASGTGSISVTWSAPSNTGGSAITGYSLAWATAAAGPWTAVALGKVLNDSVTGLTARTTYYVRLAAVNAVGTGNYGPASSATTQSSSSSGPGGGSVSSIPILWIAVIAVVVAAVLAGLALAMRSRRGGAPPPSPPPSGVNGAPPPSTPPP